VLGCTYFSCSDLQNFAWSLANLALKRDAVYSRVVNMGWVWIALVNQRACLGLRQASLLSWLGILVIHVQGMDSPSTERVCLGLRQAHFFIFCV